MSWCTLSLDAELMSHNTTIYIILVYMSYKNKNEGRGSDFALLM